MIRLVDLQPEWIDHADRRGIGVKFRCMTGHCQYLLWTLFANPLDGGPAYDGDCVQVMMDFYEATGNEQQHGPVHDRGCDRTRWKRAGDDFATMSLSPSVDAHECGHLTLCDGNFR